MTTNRAGRVVLRKIHPTTGRPNPYRTYWFEHEGVVFVVHAEYVKDVWMTSPDLDLLDHSIPGPSASETAVVAWIKSPDYWSDIAFRLSDVRQRLADVIAGPDWPRIRDAYLALLDRR